MDLNAQKYRAGDVVKHQPSGEEWLLACDEEDGLVVCCGWPESMARARECSLVTAATDADRLDTLRRVAKSCWDQARGRRAARQLAEAGKKPDVTGE